MLRTSLGVVLLAWAVQAIVIRSGLPYGDMHYTNLIAATGPGCSASHSPRMADDASTSLGSCKSNHPQDSVVA